MTLPAEALDVSVLVPAKDEAPNLPEFVRQCDEALRPAGFSFEVIVVDDGSPDDVAGVVAALAGDAFTFATGSVIEVAGGLAIPRL